MPARAIIKDKANHIKTNTSAQISISIEAILSIFVSCTHCSSIFYMVEV